MWRAMLYDLFSPDGEMDYEFLVELAMLGIIIIWLAWLF